MSKTPKQTALLAEESQSGDEQRRILMQRLGVTALPAHETMLLPIERILVPGAELVARPSKRLVKSIQQVGILQAPSVVLHRGSSMYEPEATFEVITGRRRVLAAAMVGLTSITCEVYESSTPPLSALLALIENEQRSSAWIKEVADLHRLIDEKVGLTLDDLAALGFDRRSLAEHLKMAHFPAPLLHLVLTGKMSQEVARKLARLSVAQQARLAGLAEEGEEITGERIKNVLRVQVNTGLAPLQATLAQEWTPADDVLPLPESEGSGATPVPGEALTCTESESEGACSWSLSSLLATLRRFEPLLRTEPGMQRIHLLLTALIQQVQIAQRTGTTALSDQHREDTAPSTQEGELIHV